MNLNTVHVFNIGVGHCIVRVEDVSIKVQSDFLVVGNLLLSAENPSNFLKRCFLYIELVSLGLKT
jgi:hypothetical protein